MMVAVAACVLHCVMYTQQDVFQDVSDLHWHGNLLVGTYFAVCLACTQQGLGQVCQAWTKSLSIAASLGVDRQVTTGSTVN